MVTISDRARQVLGYVAAGLEIEKPQRSTRKYITLDALEKRGLIQWTGDMWKITDKGRAVLAEEKR